MNTSLHFRRIHKRVMNRVWADISNRTRDNIAHDVEGTHGDSKWFAKKVAEDATRLFEDPTYYDNLEFTFRHSRV